MHHFLKFLKIVVGLPFFAVVGLLALIVFFFINLFFTDKNKVEKEDIKEALNRRKGLYKYRQEHKVLVNGKFFSVEKLEKNAPPSLAWDDLEPSYSPPIDQKQRCKEKAIAKRRKRKKLAKKSRQQNRC
ncbi:hypothetical protein [Aureispira sp. CCB-E]|uniref:hypothetical protein n=1 Tax=Aureispira sp. CCB-E TaxID=3051121 RepID=UPI0028688F6F|nr:hypothetical protein [Aureispira sp. CCB-E]WMX12414.1 hypothetical protein QP953_16415 [Aureispira sp. CCB-E]